MAYVLAMRGLLLSLIVLPLAALAAEVYRYVDEHGSVVFTDQPQAGAQRLEVEPAPSTTVVVPLVPQAAPAAQDTQAESFAGYEILRITEPAPDSAMHNTAGTVQVSIHLYPPLRTDLGHGLTLLLDGKPVVEYAARTHIELNDVDRGEHVLEAFVLDASGQVLIQSEPVRFTLHRASILFPWRQPPGAPLSPIPHPLPRPVP